MPSRVLLVLCLSLAQGCCAHGGLARRTSGPELEVLHGRASYYHNRFHGRCAANGERYDRRAFTAASRDLPFGTVLRVTRPDRDESVVVRINDRGPFGDHSRILDLSRAAAEALDMIQAGVVPVRVAVLRRGDGARSRCR